MNPRRYSSSLSVRDTQVAIKQIKDKCEALLARELNLTRVSAPLFVRPETGLNDNLNGTERPVAFNIRSMDDAKCEVVQSLAKWKRFALRHYGFVAGEGLYTDMNAIRRDEDLDNLHSIYVDQWDWEVVINKEDRNLGTLARYVKGVYKVFRQTEDFIVGQYPQLARYLPDEISFITSQELEDAYPGLSPREREAAYVREKGAACVMQIGGSCVRA